MPEMIATKSTDHRDSQMTPAQVLRLLCNLRVLAQSWDRAAAWNRREADRYRDPGYERIAQSCEDRADLYTHHAAQLREVIAQ